MDLIERHVTLHVSRDTMELWDIMTQHLGLESFDELAQVLVMYGAFLLASADLGYLEGLDVRDLSPDAMRAVFVPWLQSRTADQGDRP